MVRHRVLQGLLALVICTGIAQATNKLTLTAKVVTALACNTNTGGSGSETITVTSSLSPGAGAATVWVIASTVPAGVTVTGPGGVSAATPVAMTTAAGVIYTVTPSNACGSSVPAETSGSSSYTPTTLQFSYVQGTSGVANGTTIVYTADATQNLSIAETTPTVTSPLTATPSTLNVACVLSAGVYSSASTTFTLATTATVTQTASFTSTPSYLTLSGGLSPYSVPGSGNLSVSVTATGGAAGQCASIGGLGASKTTTLSVTTAAPALATVTLQIPVTITVVGPQQLSVVGSGSGGSGTAYGSLSGTALTLPTYTRYGSQVQSTLYLSSANSVSFQVDMTTMPNWLTVSSTSGHVTGGAITTLTFYSTTVADSMTPGTYETGAGSYQAISLKVAGYQNTLLYVKLVVQNTTPTLSVAGGLVQNLSWNSLQTLPTTTITLVSSSSTPIPFTITTTDLSPAAGAAVSQSAGLAFSSGTAIGVTFSALDFAGAVTGSTLSSTVSIAWPGDGGTPLVVLLNVAIQAPNSTAVLTGIAPSNLPSGAAGETFTVTLYGSGFVPSPSTTQATYVGLVTAAGALVTDSNVVATVQSSTQISVTITVPTSNASGVSSDANLNFNAAGNITIGVCNPNGSVTNPPCVTTSTIKLAIDQGPIILTNGITSASTFLPASLAPYDIISIFGNNFCTSGGTGCAYGQVLSPTISNPTASVSDSVYPNFVTPDVAGSTQRELQVYFCKGGNLAASAVISSTTCFAAPLLFATNNQINAVVPGEVLTATSASWSVFVRFATAPTLNTTTFAAGSSAAYTISAAASDPGVFIVDASSDGAIVLPNGQVADAATATSAARVRPAVSGTNYSDYIEIFMTGLGTPGTAVTGCTSVATYGTNSGLATATPANTFLDGAVIESANFAVSSNAPCFLNGANGTSPITLQIGGLSVTPSYVGWAPSAVAGLYQVNVQLPALTASTSTELSVDLSGTQTYLTQISGALQVPMIVSLNGGAATGQAINLYVQPAMAVTDANSLVTSTTRSALVSNAVFDTVSAAGGNGTPAFAIYTDSLSTSSTTGSGQFSVDAVTGEVSVVNPTTIPLGTYTVTVSVTDGSPGEGTTALPVEYITLTIQIPS
jgi:uncharacterized protein (TIGR03437 family)